ncbi:pilus assembly protein PilR, partial [Salmonella enterica subsp. enterica serovar Anatum]|nr:pilus assembly protein PilR [Salmonella enterica subsp. enterica serovar Anatum]
SPDSWSGALGFLYGLSVFVDNYGAICAVLFAVITGLISWSLPIYEHVDFVLYISELRRSTHNMIDISAMIKSKSSRYEFVNWYIK